VTRIVEVAAGVLVDRAGRVLLARRPDHGHQGGLWEFPGGKLEPGEDPETALKRELDEELGIEPLEFRPLIRVPHRYADRHVVLHAWRIERWRGEPRGREGQPLAWVTSDELVRRPMPAADRPIVAALRLPPLYAITPPVVGDEAAFFHALRNTLASGVRLVQLRCFDLDGVSAERLVVGARRLCERHGARLLANAALGSVAALAHGVHLPARWLESAAEFRKKLPPSAWLGASCHHRRELEAAVRNGVDFAVLSPVQPTASHPQAQPLGWDIFARWTASVPLPVYALGGLGRSDLTSAWRHGAQGIAAIRGLWDG